MTGPNEEDAVTPRAGTECRTNPHLRELFERAYEIAYPLLDPGQNLHTTGPAHFLRVALHDAFPDLHQQDIAILAVAIERVFHERSRSAS